MQSAFIEKYPVRKGKGLVALCHVQKDRVGNEHDVKKIKELAKDYLEYEVKEIEDFTIEKLIDFHKKLSKDDFLKDIDCFLCFIMCHGTRHQNHTWIIDREGSQNRFDKIFKEYLNDRCPALNGKPKVFFLQACRGDMEFETQNPRCTPSKKWQTDKDDFENEGSTFMPLPANSDILIAYATAPKCVSYRDPLKGTFFINELVENFKENINYLNLVEILTKTNASLAEMKGDKDQIQSSNYVSYMRKNLYFRQFSQRVVQAINESPSKVEEEIEVWKSETKKELEKKNEHETLTMLLIINFYKNMSVGKADKDELVELHQKLQRTIHDSMFDIPDHLRKEVNEINMAILELPLKQVNIMLVGKTGRGKSCTGNTLLENEAFEESDKIKPKTQKVQYGLVVANGVKITVFDTPAMMRADNYKQEIEQYISEAKNICKGEIDLFLYVLPCGLRCSTEEGFHIPMLQTIGSQFLDRCSILFTYGHHFVRWNMTKPKPSIEEKKEAFKEWSAVQTGAMGELLQAVNNRSFIIDNINFTDDERNVIRSDIFRAAMQNHD